MGPAARAAEARPRRDIQVYCTTRPAVDGPTARGSMARLLHSIRTTGSLARPLPTRWPRSCIPSALPARWPDCFPARWPRSLTARSRLDGLLPGTMARTTGSMARLLLHRLDGPIASRHDGPAPGFPPHYRLDGPTAALPARWPLNFPPHSRLEAVAQWPHPLCCGSFRPHGPSPTLTCRGRPSGAARCGPSSRTTAVSRSDAGCGSPSAAPRGGCRSPSFSCSGRCRAGRLS